MIIKTFSIQHVSLVARQLSALEDIYDCLLVLGWLASKMRRVENYLIIFLDDDQISLSVSLTPAFSKQHNIQEEVRRDILKWNLQIYVNVVNKNTTDDYLFLLKW